MRSILSTLALSLSFAPLVTAQQSPLAPAPADIIVRARTLIDGTHGEALRNAEIVIRGNRILEVRTAGTGTPPGAQVIDLGDATVLPGLIDCHTHIFLQGEVPAAAATTCSS